MLAAQQRAALSVAECNRAPPKQNLTHTNTRSDEHTGSKAALQCRKEAAPLSITAPSRIGYQLAGLRTQHIYPSPGQPSPEPTEAETLTVFPFTGSLCREFLQ